MHTYEVLGGVMGIVLGRRVAEGVMGGQNQRELGQLKQREPNHHFSAWGVFDNNNNNNANDKDVRMI